MQPGLDVSPGQGVWGKHVLGGRGNHSLPPRFLCSVRPLDYIWVMSLSMRYIKEKKSYMSGGIFISNGDQGLQLYNRSFFGEDAYWGRSVYKSPSFKTTHPCVVVLWDTGSDIVTICHMIWLQTKSGAKNKERLVRSVEGGKNVVNLIGATSCERRKCGYSQHSVPRAMSTHCPEKYKRLYREIHWSIRRNTLPPCCREMWFPVQRLKALKRSNVSHPATNKRPQYHLGVGSLMTPHKVVDVLDTLSNLYRKRFVIWDILVPS